MPGERYDIIVDAKNEEELEALGGKQFFIRATAYNDSFWSFNVIERSSYELKMQLSIHSVFVVLNHDINTTQGDWFANDDTKLVRDINACSGFHKGCGCIHVLLLTWSTSGNAVRSLIFL